MKTNSKWISCILALIVIGTSAVWAHTPVSPQSEATAGLTATEVDQFMSVTDWGEVKFGKAFTFAGFEQGKETIMDIGAAFKAGPVYIGSWYRGNVGSFAGEKRKTETTKISESTAGVLGNTHTGTSSSVYKTYNPDHTAVMLLGFGNIGINFGYLRSGKNYSGTYYDGKLQSDVTVKDSNRPEVVNKTEYSPKGYHNGARHTPFIGFGMNVGLGKMTLSPTASLEVAVQQSSEFGKKTTDTQTNAKVGRKAVEQQGNSSSYTAVIGKLGTALALGDSINSVLTFGYDFTVSAYGNKQYTAADGSKQKLGRTYTIMTDSFVIDRTNTSETKTSELEGSVADKKSHFSNTFSLGYNMKKDFTDRFTFLAGAEAKIKLTTNKTVSRQLYKKVERTVQLNPSKTLDSQTVTTTKEYPVQTTARTVFEFTPTVKAAVSYAAVPNRLFLNAGTEVMVFKGSHTTDSTTYSSFVNTKTVETKKDDGSVTKTTEATQTDRTQRLTKTGKVDPASVNLKGGLRWNIVENVGFDLVYSNTLLQAFSWTEFGDLKLACTIKF